jgi:hypothetical protein
VRILFTALSLIWTVCSGESVIFAIISGYRLTLA